MNHSKHHNSSKYQNQSETERIFEVFDTFNQDAEITRPQTSLDTAESSQYLVLAMSSLGQLGRFGNQLFQYAFLRICAEKTGALVECPPWIGQTLFGHHDAPISHRLKPAIEYKNNERNLFDIIPELIPYLEKLAGMQSHRISAEILDQGIANVDLWGFFQVPTHLLAPHKQYIQSLFRPVDDLKFALEEGLVHLRAQGKTIIGIHIRRGDYITQVRAGFTLVTPEHWYCEWLESIWSDLQDPVLFLCSDELDRVLPIFKKFNPVVAQDLGIQLPNRMQDMNLEFYLDFFILSHCDIVAISNSIFSFAACLLNEQGQQFVRPCWDFSAKFIRFDPWDSDPLLWVGDQNPKFFKSLSDVIVTTYATQGFWSALTSVILLLPRNYIKQWAIQIYLGFQIQGMIGVLKSLISILGWRSIWCS